MLRLHFNRGHGFVDCRGPDGDISVAVKSKLRHYRKKHTPPTFGFFAFFLKNGNGGSGAGPRREQLCVVFAICRFLPLLAPIHDRFLPLEKSEVAGDG